MAKYPNSGILGKNTKRREGKRDADITGSLSDVQCPHCGQSANYWLNGWAHQGDTGNFYTLSVKPREKKQEKPAPPQDDSDIPF